MPDSQVIDYCSRNADGNALIHILCDRLTEANMRLAAARRHTTEALRLLK